MAEGGKRSLGSFPTQNAQWFSHGELSQTEFPSKTVIGAGTPRLPHARFVFIWIAEAERAIYRYCICVTAWDGIFNRATQEKASCFLTFYIKKSKYQAGEREQRQARKITIPLNRGFPWLIQASINYECAAHAGHWLLFLFYLFIEKQNLFSVASKVKKSEAELLLFAKAQVCLTSFLSACLFLRKKHAPLNS